MVRLPTYEEAVTGGHWLDLVAPYVILHDYARLCRVSRSFSEQFMPRLWNDPLQTVKLLGLHPSNELDWYVWFVVHHCQGVRLATRQLVASLDFRGFASVPAEFVTTGDSNFSRTIRLFQARFPALRCVYLDGHQEYNPEDFLRPVADGNERDLYDDLSPMPLALSVAHCSSPLPYAFFRSPYWRLLRYLDISHVSGPVKNMFNDDISRLPLLRHLEILKLRGRELTDKTVFPVLCAFRGRVWSLDLSYNFLTDDTLRVIAMTCFPAASLHTEAYFETEGKLVEMRDSAGAVLGPDLSRTLSYIAEADRSGSFSHPERYLADSPAYDDQRHARMDGRSPLRGDSADDIKAGLAGTPGSATPDWHTIQEREPINPQRPIANLYLSGNKRITVRGLRYLMRCCRGYIEVLDCDAPLILGGGGSGVELRGALGCAHLFRPVVASNLQHLRIHHSLVTHIPTLVDPSSSAQANLERAETALRAQAELAYPQAFVPDLNPRLQSMTLTCLPRFSTGPLIDRLLSFLRLCCEQEQAIRRERDLMSTSRRCPAILRGLRRLRLEFEPPPPPADHFDQGWGGLDAEALLHPSSGEFSFFGDAAWSSGRTVDREQSGHGRADNLPASNFATAASSSLPPPSSSSFSSFPPSPSFRNSGRLAHYPLPGAVDSESEYVNATVHRGELDVVVRVWVGTGVASGDNNAAVNAYMANLAQPALRTDVQAATADQTQAGVPIGVCVFAAAWDAILAAGESSSKASRGQTQQQLRDVVEAVRAFRAESRAQALRGIASRPSRAAGQKTVEQRACQHWTGQLELMMPSRIDDGLTLSGGR